MATEAQCREAIETLIDKLAQVDPEVRRGSVPDRTIGVNVLDHDVTYVGQMKDGELLDVHTEPGGVRLQVRLVCSSDDLVALSQGELNFAHAWATGRVRLDASLRDLLRLRALA